jgi:hypothetical protein
MWFGRRWTGRERSGDRSLVRSQAG